MRYWFFVLSIVYTCSLGAKETLRIGVQLEGQKHVEQFIADREISSIEDYSGEFAYRDVIEQVLLLQALHFGGFRGNIELVQADHYKRRLRLLEQGLLDLSVTGVWLSDALPIKDNLYISRPLLRDGEAEAGFYVHQNNTRARQVNDKFGLQRLNAISNKNWQIDWRIMSAIGFAHLDSVSQFTQMTDMIMKGRSNVMLATFYNTDDLSFSQDNETFVPIHGLKVKLPGSRHFVVSKAAGNSEIFECVQRGLKELRSRGLINKAYRQSGYINEKVKHWMVIR